MIKFSANLGFLWANRPLPEAIRAAKAAGFAAVECHWPYETPSSEIKAALAETNLTMLGLNTSRGNVEAGDNGLSAMPDRVAEAQAAIDEALAYAVEIEALNIHVMAGFTDANAARVTFIDNLLYACEQAAKHDITILIEPLNAFDAPGYFLQNTAQAVEVIEDVGVPNLKLMFDCYHIGRTEGDIANRLNSLLPMIGHIQFASVPDRGTPDHGEVNYEPIFEKINELGWTTPIGAEYKPVEETESTLEWMKQF